MDSAAQRIARRAKFWPAALMHGNPSISPTHTAGVGTVGGMDVGSDKGSDSDVFEDVRDDLVLDADERDAAEES